MVNEKENRFIAYCLKEGYISMDKVKEILEIKTREGKSMISLIARELGWDKKKVMDVIQETHTQDISYGKNAPQEDDFLPSKGQAFGKYILIEKLGAGGMGAVYKAYHRELQTYFAIKVVLPGQMSDDSIQRFKREAVISSQLKHPHIVRVYDVGMEQDQYYIVMDYIKGKDLGKIIKEENILFRQALTIILKIAQALEHAHEKKVIHRDIKPSNILIADDKESTPYLMDFGLASIVEENTKLTRSGQLLGTPQYMSPEQALGKISFIDGRSDIYSLGAVLYELLTGNPLVIGTSVNTIVYKVINEEPIPPSKYKNSISRDLEAITMKCLEKEISRRYQKVGELTDDIERYLRGEAVLARSPGYLYRLWCKTRRNWKFFTVVLVLVILMVTVISLWRMSIPDSVALEIASLEKQAKELENSGNLKGAADIYISMLKLDSSHKEFRKAIDRIKKQKLEIAQQYEKNEDLKEAKKVYYDILDLEKNNDEAKNAIERIKYRIEDKLNGAKRLESEKLFDEALDICKKLIDWAPEDGRFGQYVLELTQKKEQCRREAREYYDRAMDVFWNQRLSEKELIICKELFEKASSHDPSFADAHFQAGRAAHRLFKIEEAIKHYKKSLKYDPNLAASKYYLASLELPILTKEINENKESINNWDKRLNEIMSNIEKTENKQISKETTNPYILLAKAHIILIKAFWVDLPNLYWEECLDYCNKTLQVYPNFSDAYFIRAQLYSYWIEVMENGYDIKIIPNPVDIDQALKDCSQTIYLDPYRIEVYALRGEIYRSIGAYDLAEKDYTKALLLKRMSEPSLYRSRAVCYMAMGKHDLAMADIDKNMYLMKYKDNNKDFFTKADAFMLRAFLKALLKDKKEAEESLTGYLSIRNPDIAQFDEFVKGIVYLFIDDEYKRVEESIKSFLKTNVNLFKMAQLLCLAIEKGESTQIVLEKVSVLLKLAPNQFCILPGLKQHIKKAAVFLPGIKGIAFIDKLNEKDFEFSAIIRPCLENLKSDKKTEGKLKALNRIFNNEYPPLTADFFIYFCDYVSERVKVQRILKLKELPSAYLYYRRACEYYFKSNFDNENKQEMLEKAKLDLKAALELEPDFMEAHYGLATIYSLLSINCANDEISAKYRESSMDHLRQAVENGWEHIEDYTLKDNDFKPLRIGEKLSLETINLWNKKREENKKNINEFKSKIKHLISRGEDILALKLLYEPKPVFFSETRDLLESTEKNVMEHFKKELNNENELYLDHKIQQLFGERGKIMWELIKRGEAPK